jgi:hypothetical protein
MSISVGQRWTYRPPQGFEASRIIIGAIVQFEGSGRVVCCSVSGAPRRHADGHLEAVTIPFLPLSEDAFLASVAAADGQEEPCLSFGAKLQEWSTDPRGLTTFTVPFDGFLDHLIANQMAKIVGLSAA